MYYSSVEMILLLQYNSDCYTTIFFNTHREFSSNHMRVTVLALFAAVIATIQIPLTNAQADPCASPTITMGPTQTNVGGTEGNDIIKGNALNNQIFAKGGDDIVCGGGGHDLINGGLGDDELYGQDGNDLLYGVDHADLLDGGLGRDVLFGGLGPDTIFGGEDGDVIFEGESDQNEGDLTIGRRSEEHTSEL